MSNLKMLREEFELFSERDTLWSKLILTYTRGNTNMPTILKVLKDHNSKALAKATNKLESYFDDKGDK